MKRVKVCFSTFIVVLAVVLGNLPVSGEQVTAKGFETPEYYGRTVLSGFDNSNALLFVYDKIASSMDDINNIIEYGTDYKIEIDISEDGYAVTPAELKTVIDVYTRDYTGHFWLNKSWSYSYYLNDKSIKIVTKIHMYCYAGREETALAKQKYDSAADKLIAGITPDMPEFERELILHDRLADHIAYEDGDRVHDAYGALVNGKAVCDGYTKAFQYLLQRVGIQSFMVTGTGNGGKHAWNIVRIDGKYYNVDLTWDDQESDTFHAYFNLTDERIKEDHTFDTTVYRIPECNSTEANYFTHFGEKIQGFSAAELGALIRKNGNKLHIYVTGDMKAFMAEFSKKVIIGGKEVKKNYSDMIYAAGLENVFVDDFTAFLGNEVLIKIIVRGDANYDGITDIRDFIHMKSIIAGNFAKNKASDVDKSGNVSATDLAELKKMLLGIKN